MGLGQWKKKLYFGKVLDRILDAQNNEFYLVYLASVEMHMYVDDVNFVLLSTG